MTHTHPPSELFRKFTRFGVGMLPLVTKKCSKRCFIHKKITYNDLVQLISTTNAKGESGEEPKKTKNKQNNSDKYQVNAQVAKDMEPCNIRSLLLYSIVRLDVIITVFFSLEGPPQLEVDEYEVQEKSRKDHSTQGMKYFLGQSSPSDVFTSILVFRSIREREGYIFP